MTTPVALWLAAALAVAAGLDLWLNGGRTLVALGREGVALIDWLAFWR